MTTIMDFSNKLQDVVNQADLSDEDFGTKMEELSALRNEIDSYVELIEHLKDNIKSGCANQPERWNRAVGLLLPPATGLRL